MVNTVLFSIPARLQWANRTMYSTRFAMQISWEEIKVTSTSTIQYRTFALFTMFLPVSASVIQRHRTIFYHCERASSHTVRKQNIKRVASTFQTAVFFDMCHESFHVWKWRQTFVLESAIADFQFCGWLKDGGGILCASYNRNLYVTRNFFNDVTRLKWTVSATSNVKLN